MGWIDAGCNDYIVKPLSFEELRRKIKNLVV
jgi:DNA-binding response OmpR family regulator